MATVKKKKIESKKATPAKKTSLGKKVALEATYKKEQARYLGYKAKEALSKASPTTRTALKVAGKGGLVGAAAAGGYAIGSAIEKRTGVGKKLGTKAYEMLNPEKAAQLKKAKETTVKEKASAKTAVVKDKPTVTKEKPKKTSTSSAKKESYPVYKKGGKESSDFKANFRQARKEGKSSFTWQGRKYTTELKKTGK